MQLPNLENCTIAIIGLGYVGLPLAIQFNQTKNSKLNGSQLSRNVIGFDLDQSRINDLKNNIDRTNEIDKEDLIKNEKILFTNNSKFLEDADIFIVTVPTPIDIDNNPDLTYLVNASTLIGKVLKNRKTKNVPIIIFESTVFPGATEEVCAPLIESNSEKKYKKDFLCGYSPERINPGDKSKRLIDIIKVTSGCNDECAFFVDNLYGSIINAGTYKAPSIKVAEAAKVIENTQRDLNIALVNELSLIFSKMEIDTIDVLDAAATKWNFLNFRPGLVGGHCIGVDPYYLTWKSKEIGYSPEIILSGRKVNENMTTFVAEKVKAESSKRGIKLENTNVLIIGYTFKENCPDIRNSKVIKLINEFMAIFPEVDVFDPIADSSKLDKSIKENIIESFPTKKKYQIIILCVAHKILEKIGYENYHSILKINGFIFDLKGILKRNENVIRP